MNLVEGIAASPGIAVGPTVVHLPDLPPLPARRPDDIAAERDRLKSCIALVTGRLAEMEAKLSDTGDVAEIFEAHRMFLEDPSFSGEAMRLIAEETMIAEVAVSRVTDEIAQEFEAIGDEYFSARAVDVRDIGTQVLRELFGLGPAGFADLDPENPVVIIGHDLTPSETTTIPPGAALAFVTEIGSPSSHTAILARSLGIPAVVGVEEITQIVEGITVAVDGGRGLVWVEPDDATREDLAERSREEKALEDDALTRAFQPAVTADGRSVEVVANIGSAADAARAHEAGAEGVGLFRTEFLFIDRGEAPDEEEQFEAYRQVFDVFGDRPVVVRTLDVGGDKDVPGIDVGNELNPFLGKRGIRATLAEPDLFSHQLRALLRAAVGANLKLMFPMVATLEEIHHARAAVEQAAASLDREGTPRVHDFEIGIMIEVPSAAVTSDLLAPHVDFFSIGTNDLTQYTLAVDRTNPSVAGLADALHPAVLRLIGSVIESAHAHSKWVGLCGELAGDPLAAPVLLGLDLDEWSMNATAIPLVKDRVRSLSSAMSVEVASRCLAATSAEEVRDILAAV